MSYLLPPVAEFSLKAGFPDHAPDRIHRSKTPYLAALNGPNSLLHTVQALHDLGVSRARARLLPDIGRALEPETRLHRVEPFEYGISSDGYWQIRLAVNIREDNRLHRFHPLIAIGLPSLDAVTCWKRGRVAPAAPWDLEKPPPPFSPLEGYHRFYLEPGAMPADWTNRITPAERLALQLCDRFPSLRDVGEPPERMSERMLLVSHSGMEERDNPLAGVITNVNDSMISQIGTALDLVEVFLTHAMETIACIDLLGGYEFIISFEPAEGRYTEFELDRNATPDKVARWFNAYPHRRIASVHEQHDVRVSIDARPSPTLWSHNDVNIRRITDRIAEWYLQGSTRTELWDRDGTTLRYKLPDETLDASEMLSLARAYLPEFIPAYPTQVYVTGGMNTEGLLLGLVSHWLRDGPVLGMDYSDWALFTLEQQVALCGLLVQRGRHKDQLALFETALRCLLDFEIKTWLEMYRYEKIGLDRPDDSSPLAQLGFCLPLGGLAALHAPSLMIRIPRDYTTDPEAKDIETKLAVLEALFVPAHIPVQHIWEIDWMRLDDTSYLGGIDEEDRTDLVPAAVRLFDE